MTLGEYIKQYREVHGMSLREFARQAEISPAALSNLERGKNNNGTPLKATFFMLKKAATVMGMSVSDLCMIVDDTIELNSPVPLDDEAAIMLNLFQKASPEIRAAALAVLKSQI